MKIKNLLMIVALLFTAVGTFAQSQDDKRVMADAEKAKMKLQKMENGLDQFFSNASGYAIFPNVGEGALIVGGASGNGVLYENGVAVGMTSLKKVDVGLQAGGQALTEIIFFETEDALNEFKQGEYELTAEVNAVALDKGAAINANYTDGVVVFTKAKKGLMADVSVGGQKFEYTDLENMRE